LQLLGFELHGRGQAAAYTEPGPSLYGGGQIFRLPPHGEARECSTEELRLGIEIAERIPVSAIDRPQARHETALHRFLLGAAEVNNADSLIDYVIALEAVLLPDGSAGELGLRLALFGASYLGSSAEERKALDREFRDVYTMRSQLVHGAKHPRYEDVGSMTRIARRLAAAVLVKGLRGGWPSQEQLRDLVLS
jgi:hypothetical protein